MKKMTLQPIYDAIQFPFCTFKDGDYSRFMIGIMSNFEIRHFQPQEMICYELDECLEVYFVMDGKYNVGYQINNTKFWRR